MTVTLYDWDEIYERAMDKPCGHPMLKAKDEARCQLQSLILEKIKIDIEAEESPEEAIDDYLEDSNTIPMFDENGNLVTEIDKGFAWRYENE